MQYVSLGRSGLKVSRLALGGFSFGDPNNQSWMLGEESSRPIIRRALELGINFIDTSDRYSAGVSESIIGRAWSDFTARDNLVIATKAFWPTGEGANQRGLSRKHLFNAIDASLRRLKTDYVDLYLSHRRDYYTPLEETYDAFNDIIKAGKARYIGVSNVMAWEVMKIVAICERHGWARPISVQNHYNLAYREEEREMLPLCIDQGIGATPWSPLARGFLSRSRADSERTTRDQSDRFVNNWFGDGGDLAVLTALEERSKKLGLPMAKVALAWVLARDGVCAPVIGATKVSHVEDAVSALDIELSPDDVAALEAPYRPKPVLLHR